MGQRGGVAFRGCLYPFFNINQHAIENFQSFPSPFFLFFPSLVFPKKEKKTVLKLLFKLNAVNLIRFKNIMIFTLMKVSKEISEVTSN